MKLWKFSGTFLTATGILHTLVALHLSKDAYAGMIRDGFVNSAIHDVNRELALWFLVCGILLILWGQTLRYYIKKEQKPAPEFVGYSVLLFAVIGCIIEPVSGFWLFLPQAFIIIRANIKFKRMRIKSR